MKSNANAYATEKWAEAKSQFVAAVKAARNAAEAAARRVRAECGQNMDVWQIMPDGDRITFRIGNANYALRPLLAGDWDIDVLKPGEHWTVTLSALEAERQFILQWGTPEHWEAAWAATQK